MRPAPEKNRLFRWAAGLSGRIQRRLSHAVIESGGRSCAVLGQVDWVRPHLQRVCLGWQEGVTVRERVMWHGPDAVTALWNAARSHGVAVCAGVPLTPQQAKEVVNAPRMVGLSRPTPASMEEFWREASNSLRADLRMIKRHGYTCSWEEDLAGLPEFLTRFHQPSVRARHGAEGFAITEEDVAKLQGSATHRLGRIFRKGEWVAGHLVEYVHGKLWMRQLGWRDGAEEELRAGVVGAIYLNGIELAVQLKAESLVFGAADPFLENGLFTYKAKWGGELDVALATPLSLGWAFDPGHPQGRRFLEEHALLFSVAGGKYAVLGARLPTLDGRHHSLRKGLTCWYRLRERPDENGGRMNVDLPSRLRAWFAREELPDF